MLNGKETPGNMNEFTKIKDHLRVLARSSPEDKYLLVTGLQLCDATVAVTGDGSNDAPALTKADVGLSMNITGTDIAKGSSDIILLDDNFQSIVVALKYGRNVYDCVRKFLQFQLSVNVVVMFIVVFGSVVLKDSPLNAVQMLWVNLIMDTLGALALATEPPSMEILNRAPYKKDNAIVTELMWRNVFGHAIYQVIVLMIVIFVAPGWVCNDYWTKCLAYSAPGECTSYNPFYANSLYQTAESVAWWQELDLARDQYDQGLLDIMICQNYQATIINDDWADFSLSSCVADPTIVNNDDYYFSPADQLVGSRTEKLLHYTLVFQAFVFMQLFNQINARKLEQDENNVFKGILDNYLFVCVMIFTFVMQMVLVEFGGRAVKTFPLSIAQNLFCIALGFGELLWHPVIKFFPMRYFQLWNLDEPYEEDGEEE